MKAADLKAWREEVGWSQSQLARALLVTDRTVSRWETGEHRISERTRKQIRELCAAKHLKRPRGV